MRSALHALNDDSCAIGIERQRYVATRTAKRSWTATRPSPIVVVDTLQDVVLVNVERVVIDVFAVGVEIELVGRGAPAVASTRAASLRVHAVGQRVVREPSVDRQFDARTAAGKRASEPMIAVTAAVDDDGRRLAGRFVELKGIWWDLLAVLDNLAIGKCGVSRPAID